jgi:DNA-binding XRE family transcriptional regulator
MRVDKQREKKFNKLRGIVARSTIGFEDGAKALGISTSTLWGYTSGKRSPNLNMAKKICKVFGAEWSEVEP